MFVKHERLNQFFQDLEIDYLYHLGLDSGMDLANIFADVKYVLFARDNDDVEVVAHEFAKKWYNMGEDSFIFKPIYKTERFHMYKIGPIIAISYGVGMPSMLICLNEIVKLLAHIKNYDVTFFKFSPAGGLGVAVGTIVISDEAVNTAFKSEFKNIECGEWYMYPTQFDASIINDLMKLNHINLIRGKTIGAYDFYEEQARLDGALPLVYEEVERNSYLTRAEQNGIKAFNMEDIAFAGFCNKLGIKACALSCVVVNRWDSDPLPLTHEEQKRVLYNAVNLVNDYIIGKLC